MAEESQECENLQVVSKMKQPGRKDPHKDNSTTQQSLTIRSTDLVYKIIYGSTQYSVKILLLQDSFPGNLKALIIMSRR